MTDNDPFMALTRRLFGRDEAPAEIEPPDPTRSNVSPREGQPAAPSDPDQQMRDFVRDLFTPTD